MITKFASTRPRRLRELRLAGRGDASELADCGRGDAAFSEPARGATVLIRLGVSTMNQLLGITAAPSKSWDADPVTHVLP